MAGTTKPKVLVVGSGGREHALVWKLAQSQRDPQLYALPGSSAIKDLAECLPGDPLDPAAVVGACRKHGIELVVVGPEAPLAAGLSDALKNSGIACFGPGKVAAQLESSKAFAKGFMKRCGIPTAKFEVYDDAQKALDAAAELALPLVVKADGLAAGKGVFVCKTRKEALAAVQELMVDKKCGVSGARVILEECLTGPEVTVLALSDGKVMRALPVSRDHKRLLDNDEGPNTGGMGALCPVGGLGKDTLAKVEDILARMIRGFEISHIDYRGVLYVGLMLTPDGPKVLEFNVRFGDPETQAVLPVVENDLLELVLACADGKLGAVKLLAPKHAAVGVVLASDGYPDKPAVGRVITGIAAAIQMRDVHVFHAGTRLDGTKWLTAGGRVLTVVGLGKNIEAARERAYAAAQLIHFDGMQHRSDIALSGVHA